MSALHATGRVIKTVNVAGAAGKRKRARRIYGKRMPASAFVAVSIKRMFLGGAISESPRNKAINQKSTLKKACKRPSQNEKSERTREQIKPAILLLKVGE